MVRIVKQPENFTPIGEGLIFVVQSDERCDLEVAIINTLTGEEVGRKLIYDTAEAVVDIAPYIAGMSPLTVPKRHFSELLSAPAASYMIVVQREGEVVESEEVWVSNNIVKEGVGVASVFATGECREIAYGDDDDLKIKAPEAGLISVEVLSDIGESYSYSINSESGRAMFHLGTRMFDESVTRIVVEVYCNEEFLQSIDYEIVPRGANSVRLMWFSPIGTLEHHTFAATLSRTLVSKQRQRFVGSNGEVCSSISAEQTTIGSKRCLERLLAALATIVTAPKVWIEQAEEYVPAAVLDSEAAISRLGEVGQLSVTLEHNRKEVTL